MTNNDTTLQLSTVLNQECTRAGVHCQSKKRALEIISELAAKQLSLPSQVVFEAILTREKMGSTGIGNGIAIPHGKLEEDTMRAVGVFVQLETPIAFDAIDNQPVDLLFALLVPADRVTRSCIKSSRTPKVDRMKHNNPMASFFVVVRRNSTWY